ncbi:hypothetical protein XELAEV_18022353mg [Xenopus laevis]|uniref:55 kDa erythrocyte membrane protein n=1 Tax=Xenopus laevis TaxID=8355 RepID=A0A974HN48_XENLA|nr:hypothetical protein XELAEV_18022353mg [Xenopus laevis]
MTMKFERTDNPLCDSSSVRTALSDLYLETLLQNRGSAKGSQTSASSHTEELYTNGSAAPGTEEKKRVRLVQFERETEEPMGITLKVNSQQSCIVARILHGGFIHRQGSLHVGDEILEINGKSVRNQSVDHLQSVLKESKGTVVLKVSPSQSNRKPPLQMYVRALFDYNPLSDALIPCREAGLTFHTGDILQIINKDDSNWWQGRLQGEGSAGLIPSPELQEWYMEHECHKVCAPYRLYGQRRSPHYSRAPPVAPQRPARLAHTPVFDQLDVVSYEEVVSLPAFTRKTLVLIGVSGVGRSHIKNTLLAKYPERFVYPAPYTSRPPKRGEEESGSYHFVSAEEMSRAISENEFLEYGSFSGYMFGTKIQTVKELHKDGKVAILDIEPQTLKMVRTAELAPFIVFFSPTDKDESEALQKLRADSDVLRSRYAQHFDLTLVNNGVEQTVQDLLEAFDAACSSPQWVPVTWVY